VAARVFGALNGANIRMISQGASLLNLSLVVAEADLARAVRSLHREFFSKLDENVFEAAGAVTSPLAATATWARPSSSPLPPTAAALCADDTNCMTPP